MSQTGFAKRMELRDWAADAQHVKTDEHGQRCRPAGKNLFD
jgi:hypothetical protein